MRNNKKIIGVITSIIVITILAASAFLIFHSTSDLPQRCVFDILTPEEVVTIFFEVKITALNSPDASILPYLSSRTRNFLRADNTEIARGEAFIFVNAEAFILVHHTRNMLDEPVTRVSFHSPPHQGEDINQRYKYTLLEEALKKFLGEPQMRGWAYGHRHEVSFWQINEGTISLSISRNYRISSIIMAFSTEIREPVLLSFDID